MKENCMEKESSIEVSQIYEFADEPQETDEE